MRKLTYDEVKEYIEVKSDSGCKLVSKEYINASKKITFQCLCGELFETSFNSFMSGNKRQCNKCGKLIKKNKQLLDYKNINSILNDLGYKLVSKNYNGVNSKITLKDQDNYLYYATLHEIRYHKPDKFNPKYPYSISNIKNWCKINDVQFTLISDKYEGNKKKLSWKCLNDNCGEIFKMSLSDVLRGHNCPVCCGRQVSLSTCLATNLPELSKEFHPTKNGTLTPYDFTVYSNKRIWWLCPICKNEWCTKISTRVALQSGCPECASISKGRNLTKDALEKLYINFISEAKFDDCRDQLPLPFDFYLVDYDVCIEIDGIQHRRPIEFFGGIESYKILKLHDEIKTNYCKEKNIGLIRIEYERIKDIVKYLPQELQKYNIIKNAKELSQTLLEMSRGVFNCDERRNIN